MQLGTKGSWAVSRSCHRNSLVRALPLVQHVLSPPNIVTGNRIPAAPWCYCAVLESESATGSSAGQHLGQLPPRSLPWVRRRVGDGLPRLLQSGVSHMGRKFRSWAENKQTKTVSSALLRIPSSIRPMLLFYNMCAFFQAEFTYSAFSFCLFMSKSLALALYYEVRCCLSPSSYIMTLLHGAFCFCLSTKAVFFCNGLHAWFLTSVSVSLPVPAPTPAYTHHTAYILTIS